MRRSRRRNSRRESQRANRRLPTEIRLSPVSYVGPRGHSLDDIFRSYRSTGRVRSKLPRNVNLLKKSTRFAAPNLYSNYSGPRELRPPSKVGALPSASPGLKVCVQRSQRKEVLHALGKSGRAGQKTPRFTWKSKIRCK